MSEPKYILKEEIECVNREVAVEVLHELGIEVDVDPEGTWEDILNEVTRLSDES